MTIKKPMLGVAVKDVKDLVYPLIASPKLDGIRCLKIDGKVLSRSFKPIPNHHIRTTLEAALPDNIDGEIMIGDTFQAVSSGVMSREGEPDFSYWAFDYVEDLERPYDKRIEDLETVISQVNRDNIKKVSETIVRSCVELSVFEQEVLSQGYEGVMLRAPKSPYKCGRSTLREQYLLKIKPFKESEAVIVGFEEMMHNENTLEADELGYAKRSSAKDGKVPAGTLGKFVVRDIHTQIEFSIGTGKGLTQELRQKIWDNRGAFRKRIVKYRYQDHGVKVAPRTPIWLGFRSNLDL